MNKHISEKINDALALDSRYVHRNTQKYLTQHDKALDEIVNGKKIGHWIWYVFPQLTGLGHGNIQYDIESPERAIECLENPTFLHNYHTTLTALSKSNGKLLNSIFKDDDKKVISSLTLFEWAASRIPQNQDIKALQRTIQNVRNKFGTNKCCNYTQRVIQNYEKQQFQTVLKNLRNSNKCARKLSAEEIISIFVDAKDAGHYTNGNSRLPLDNNILPEKAQLMRKFSVAFQKECEGQKLTFSNTNGVNKNGMRTKSVMNFLGVNNTAELQRIVNGAVQNKFIDF